MGVVILLTLQILVAILTTDQIQPVDHIERAVDRFGIGHVLATRDYRGRKVDILGFRNHIRKFRIRGVALPDGKAGYSLQEFLELDEERFIEIVVGTVQCCIPLVGPPALAAIDRERRIGGIHGDHAFLAQVAGSLIKTTFVAIGEAALHAAFRTPGGRRDVDLFIKIKIFRLDREFGFAVLAGAGLGRHGFSLTFHSLYK